MEFKEWLIKTKKISSRVACDINSRYKRAINLLNVKTVNAETMNKLLKNDKFNNLKDTVKSQIKRAVILYYEYTKE